MKTKTSLALNSRRKVPLLPTQEEFLREAQIPSKFRAHAPRGYDSLLSEVHRNQLATRWAPAKPRPFLILVTPHDQSMTWMELSVRLMLDAFDRSEVRSGILCDFDFWKDSRASRLLASGEHWYIAKCRNVFQGVHEADIAVLTNIVIHNHSDLDSLAHFVSIRRLCSDYAMTILTSDSVKALLTAADSKHASGLPTHTALKWLMQEDANEVLHL